MREWRSYQLLLVVSLMTSLAVSQNIMENNNGKPGMTISIIPFDDNQSADSSIRNDSNDSSCRPPLPLRGGVLTGTKLSLLVALPLTFKSTPVLSPGFFQLASAILAMDHFNQRNSVVVPELESIHDCPIQIDFSTLQILDTGTTDQNNALSTILQSTTTPHAILGPYDESPAVELSVLATSLQIPMVTHRGLDHNLLWPNKHPMVTQLNPDLYEEMIFLGDYLVHTGRTDYIAVLYASSADSAVQRLEAFRGVANVLGMDHVQAFGYVSPATPIDSRPVQTIPVAMKKLAATGYRTIVWITPYSEEDWMPVGKEANRWELDVGNHLWIVGASLELDRPQDGVLNQSGNTSSNSAEEAAADLDEFLSILDTLNESTSEEFLQNLQEMQMMDKAPEGALEKFQEDMENMKFMFHSALLRQVEMLDRSYWEHSKYMQAWMQLNSSFFERVQQFNPVSTEAYQQEWENTVLSSLFMGWVDRKDLPSSKKQFPPDDLFSNPIPYSTSPRAGAMNLYDAVISVGLGACKAVAKTTGNITGKILQDEIRSIQFQGSNGEVRFGDGFAGSRSGKTVSYGVYNVFPEGIFRKPFTLTKYRNATDGKWYDVEPFIYADGTNSPPALLRNPADQNYLSDGIRVTGLALATSGYFVILSSFLWILTHRHHSVVIASQPIFLFGMCGGALLGITAIVLLSFDERHWSVEALTASCIALPWFVAGGHIVTYNMLFTKLWRVNRVLQFSRRKVAIKHVIWPALLLETTAVIMLSIWSSRTDYGWQRIEIDELTGETMGKCADSSQEVAFFIPIFILAMIPTILTGVMAWKTIDVDAAYSEAKWIFALMLVHFQVSLVGVPVFFILEGVSTDGRYLGCVLLLWTYPMTTMGLIMVPKMVAVHFPAGFGRESTTRGSSGGVRVTGISSPSGNTSTSRDQTSGHCHAVVTQE